MQHVLFRNMHYFLWSPFIKTLGLVNLKVEIKYKQNLT